MTSKGVSAIGPRASIIDDVAGTAFARFKGSQCHEGFVSGTGRVGTTQRAIEKRLVNGFAQHFPAFAVDTVDK